MRPIKYLNGNDRAWINAIRGMCRLLYRDKAKLYTLDPEYQDMVRRVAAEELCPLSHEVRNRLFVRAVQACALPSLPR